MVNRTRLETVIINYMQTSCTTATPLIMQHFTISHNHRLITGFNGTGFTVTNNHRCPPAYFSMTVLQII